MTIQASHPAFDTALADLDRGVDRLRDSRDAISRDVATLLDGGWTGIAADAFDRSWEEWRAGAAEVLAALAAMRNLVADVHDDLTERDTATGTALASVGGRLADRLGDRWGR